MSDTIQRTLAKPLTPAELELALKTATESIDGFEFIAASVPELPPEAREMHALCRAVIHLNARAPKQISVTRTGAGPGASLGTSNVDMRDGTTTDTNPDPLKAALKTIRLYIPSDDRPIDEVSVSGGCLDELLSALKVVEAHVNERAELEARRDRYLLADPKNCFLTQAPSVGPRYWTDLKDLLDAEGIV